MRRLLTLIFLAAVAVPAAAQETPRPPRPPRPPRDTTEGGYGFGFGSEGRSVGVQVFRRGRLGLLVDLSPDPARDTIGARVAGVTPGGPADRAGVQTGDVVVRLNGTRLAGADAGARRREGGEETEESRPGSRLIELASRLDGGDTVRLELRRDTQTLNVTLVAGSSGLEAFTRQFQLEPGRMGTRIPMPGGEMLFNFTGEPFADLELVKVNPGLAEYFGTSEGLLVVNASSDSALGLRAGDVILTIGGRKPASPAHALRILGTYEAGETVSFDVMRMKRHVTVNGKVPEHRSWRVRPNGLDFDEFMMPDISRDLEWLELAPGERMPALPSPGMEMVQPRGMMKLPSMPVNRFKLTKQVIAA